MFLYVSGCSNKLMLMIKLAKMSTYNLPETIPQEDTSDTTEIVVTADVHQPSAIWSDEITELETTSMS